MFRLEHWSFGVGDRFAHEAAAQLRAFQEIHALGTTVIPVWNKSHREHTFVGSQPASVREAAAAAVSELDWKLPWHVDADHIRLDTVDAFAPSSDMFTIDVADSIGQPASDAEVESFLARHSELRGPLIVKGLDELLEMDKESTAAIARKYIAAVKEARRIYTHIAELKGGAENFIAEVSMDETDTPQTPRELLVILALLADAGVRLQTIAPKFTGRFNKGVDYVGDLRQFEREFRDDLAVLDFGMTVYGLPPNLKISVHSGSDKFSLYPIIRRVLKRTGAGIHLKTAGTTWLEELIGLAESGGDGLALVQEIYAYALEHVDEFCAPYASVIDIDRAQLPPASETATWSGEHFARVLRHLPARPADSPFNASIRQLLHVSFKVAAKMGDRYLQLLKTHRDIVGKQVTDNLLQRHLIPLFGKENA